MVEITSRENLQATVSLLADRSIRVRNRVAIFLEENLPRWQPDLSAIAAGETDPLIRERLAVILRLGTTPDPLAQWRFLSDEMALTLRDGFIAVSLLDQERVTSRLELLRLLQTVSDEWFAQLPEEAAPAEKVQNLMQFLFGSGRLKGNSHDYYSLDNCFLHRMLESGHGLPVTLCILAVILAEDAGLPLFGIGLPLHFITGHFQGPKGIAFYDCFDDGREVTREECEQYLHSRGIYFHPQLLSPCGNSAALYRVLVNAKHIAQRRRQNEQLELIEALQRAAEENGG